MSHQERVHWDERFRAGEHADSEADPFLLQLEQYRDLFPQKREALDIACGAGRNAVWLAQRGWHVTACDISIEGLKRAKTLAETQGIAIRFFCQDLETASLRANRFDLIICFFYLQRALFPLMKAALRSQGLLVFKTYTTDQQRFPGRPRHPTHFLQPQELLREFHDFRILSYQEIVQGKGVAQMIAIKLQ